MAIDKYITTDFAAENDGDMIVRSKLATFVNVGTSESPDWELQGRGVEDSAIDIEFEESSVTDITGVTVTRVDAIRETQSLSNLTLRKGSKMLFNVVKNLEEGAKEKFSNKEILKVRYYLEETDGENTVYHAELHKNCTIIPSKEGGSAYVDMDVELRFSGDKTLGTVTVDSETKKVTFTPLSAKS